MGILGRSLEARGIAGGSGRGSLNFISLLKGIFRKSDIWALDRIRVGEDSNRNLKKARSLVAQNLNSISWLASWQGCSLYTSTLLCDIGWTKHPDYQEIHTLMRVLRSQIPRISLRQCTLSAVMVSKNNIKFVNSEE